MKVTDRHVLFLRGVLSNWHKCRLVTSSDEIKEAFGFDAHVGGELVFYYSEHMFMYLKALAFNDMENAKNIYEAATPRDAKDFGRSVSGFDNKIWEEARYKAMKFALAKKFWQCGEFNRTVMNPEYSGKTFVECNPHDRIWAVGLDEDDPRADDEGSWLGLNLLGKALTETRDCFGIRI